MAFIAIPVASAALVTGTTLFGISAFAKRVRARKQHRDPWRDKELYEDEDGVATEESMRDYKVSTQKRTLLISTIAAVAVSVASSVCLLSMRRYGQSEWEGICELVATWLFTANWVCCGRRRTVLQERRYHC